MRAIVPTAPVAISGPAWSRAAFVQLANELHDLQTARIALSRCLTHDQTAGFVMLSPQASARLRQAIESIAAAIDDVRAVDAWLATTHQLHDCPVK